MRCGISYDTVWSTMVEVVSVTRVGIVTIRACKRGVQGVHRTRARAQGARKSSGFRVKFWYRTITP